MQRYLTVYESYETGRWAVFDNKTTFSFFGFIYIKETESTTWTFTHNQEKPPFFIQIFKDEGNGMLTKIDYASISITPDQIVVTFPVAVKGRIVSTFVNPSEYTP